jgi:hypothetical protein
MEGRAPASTQNIQTKNGIDGCNAAPKLGPRIHIRVHIDKKPAGFNVAFLRRHVQRGAAAAKTRHEERRAGASERK